MTRANLTAERVRELFDYDKERGVLVVRVSNSNRSPVGSAPNCKTGTGYSCVRIDGRLYKRHRVIWLHQTGSWPVNHIDHINGDHTDDRIENLRDVDRQVNQQNMRVAYSSNALGLLGVCGSGHKYRAQIRIDGKTKHLGVFVSAQEAHDVYIKAKRAMHAGCTI